MMPSAGKQECRHVCEVIRQVREVVHMLDVYVQE